MQYLDVPFREKDQAKALGARWDAVRKKWFVPDGLCADLTSFSRWLPQTQDLAEVKDTAVDQNPDQAAIGLAQLLQQVEQSINQQFVKSLWVKAEVAEMRVRRHAYLTLVESDEAGQPLAKAQGIIWQDQLNQLLQRFEQATGSALGAGQKILLKVHLRFSPQYGLSLDIEDIDPSYTLGDIAAQQHKMRQTLIAQGLYDRNRQLPLPTDYFRVAVIAPPAAAGLGDFQQDANLLQRHGLCKFHYFHAAFQGAQVEQEFMAALDAVEAQHAMVPFDALIVIRGGGAQLDLHHLNKLVLAQRLALMPMPVLTGIGHERDTTILDEVAALRLDTPSKAIAQIRDTIFGRAQKIRSDWQSLRTIALQHVQTTRRNIEQNHTQVSHLLRHYLAQTRNRLLQLRNRLHRYATTRVQSRMQHLQKLQQTLKQMPPYHLRRWRERLLPLHQQVQSRPLQHVQQMRERLRYRISLVLQAGPNRQLQRGFALVKDSEGELVTRAAQLQTRQSIQITFEDDTVSAKVEAP